MLLILFVFQILFATQGDAGQEIAFLEIGLGAKAFALGSAYVAHEPDASSLYWNPAALAFLDKSELSTMQNKLSTDASYYYLGGVFPGTAFNWGFSWVQIEMLNIPETSATLNNNEVEILDTLTYHADAFILGGGRKITEKLAWGFNAKYISRKISEEYGESTGYSVALGIMYKINDSLVWGLNADNIANEQKYDTGTTETVPAKYTTGFNIQVSPGIKLLLNAEKRSDQNSLVKGHTGLEFIFNKNINFFLGHDYDRLTAGAGFSFYGIFADYAYIAENSNSLGAEHFVTLGVKW